MKIDKVVVGMICEIKIDTGISLWQAIKLRIAGKGYLPIAKAIADEVVVLMRENKKADGQ